MLEATVEADPKLAKASGQQLFQFLVGEIEARKVSPQNDLLTVITEATIDGSEVTDELRWGMAQLLMIAGHETTVNALANLVHHLSTRPALRAKVAVDAVARSKVITESLRLDSPVFGLARTVVRDTLLNGVGLSRNDRILVCYAAANRDPARFPSPDTFDCERTENGHHLAFGYGRHRCLGEHLARLELDIFAQEFLHRIPDYRIVLGSEVEMRIAAVRGPKRLDIQWDV
jgi:cytochrome P450